MALTPDVVDGGIIQSAWGNEIRNRTCQVFTSAAEREAQWPAPPDGALCFLSGTGRLMQYKAGAGGWGRGIWTTELSIIPDTGSNYITLDMPGGTSARIISNVPLALSAVPLSLISSGDLRIEAAVGGVLLLRTVGTQIQAASVPDGAYSNRPWTIYKMGGTGGTGIGVSDWLGGYAASIVLARPGGTGPMEWEFVNSAGSGYVPIRAQSYQTGALLTAVHRAVDLGAEGVLAALAKLSARIVTEPAEPNLEPLEGMEPPGTGDQQPVDRLTLMPAAGVHKLLAPTEESVDLGAVVAGLVLAVQELTARLEALEGGTA